MASSIASSIGAGGTSPSSSNTATSAAQPKAVCYGVFMLTKHGKSRDSLRIVIVRDDGLVLLEGGAPDDLSKPLYSKAQLPGPAAPPELCDYYRRAELRRQVPLATLQTLDIRSHGCTIRLGIMHEEDLVLSDSESNYMSQFLMALDHAVRKANVFVKGTKAMQQVFEAADMKLEKPENAVSIADKLARRARLKGASLGSGGLSPAGGPFSLLDWNLTMLPPAPTIDVVAACGNDVAKSLADHVIIVIGHVYLHRPPHMPPPADPNDRVKLRVLALSRHALFLLLPDRGEIKYKGSLFALTKIELLPATKKGAGTPDSSAAPTPAGSFPGTPTNAADQQGPGVAARPGGSNPVASSSSITDAIVDQEKMVLHMDEPQVPQFILSFKRSKSSEPTSDVTNSIKAVASSIVSLFERQGYPLPIVEHTLKNTTAHSRENSAAAGSAPNTPRSGSVAASSVPPQQPQPQQLLTPLQRPVLPQPESNTLSPIIPRPLDSSNLVIAPTVPTFSRAASSGGADQQPPPSSLSANNNSNNNSNSNNNNNGSYQEPQLRAPPSSDNNNNDSSNNFNSHAPVERRMTGLPAADNNNNSASSAVSASASAAAAASSGFDSPSSSGAAQSPVAAPQSSPTPAAAATPRPAAPAQPQETQAAPAGARSLQTTAVKLLPPQEKERFKRRVRLLYESYYPAGLAQFEATVSSVLATFEQSEPELISKMCTKYNVDPLLEKRSALQTGTLPAYEVEDMLQQQQRAGPQQPASPSSTNIAATTAVGVKSMAPQEKERFARRCRLFYERYFPEGLPAFETSLAVVFSSYDLPEAELVGLMCGKYKVDPAAEHSNAGAAKLLPAAKQAQFDQQSQAAVAGSPSQTLLESPSFSALRAAPGADPSAFVKNMPPQEKERVKRRVRHFYENHHPAGLQTFESTIATALSRYEMTEAQVLERMAQKYNVDAALEQQEAAAAGLLPPPLSDADAAEAAFIAALPRLDESAFGPLAESSSSLRRNSSGSPPASPQRAHSASPSAAVRSPSAGDVNESGNFVSHDALNAADAQQVALRMATNLETSKNIPDFRKPERSLAALFSNPAALLVRRVLRLTSKLNWESRIAVVTQHQLILCGEDKTVRRSIVLADITNVIITYHWQATAVTVLVKDQHDCVLRGHSTTPKEHMMSHLAGIIIELNPNIKLARDTVTTSKKLKEVVSAGRRLAKDGSYVEPADEVKQVKSGAMESPVRRALSVPAITGAVRTGSPPPTPSQFVRNLVDSEKQRVKQRVKLFYENHYKEGLATFEDNIATVLSTSTLTESEVMAKVAAKYKVDPLLEQSQARANGLLPPPRKSSISNSNTLLSPTSPASPSAARAAANAAESPKAGGQMQPVVVSGVPVRDLPPAEKERVKQRVKLFYENYFKEGLANFDANIATVFATGTYDEAILFQRVTTKYQCRAEDEERLARAAGLLPAHHPLLAAVAPAPSSPASPPASLPPSVPASPTASPRAAADTNTSTSNTATVVRVADIVSNSSDKNSANAGSAPRALSVTGEVNEWVSPEKRRLSAAGDIASGAPGSLASASSALAAATASFIIFSDVFGLSTAPSHRSVSCRAVIFDSVKQTAAAAASAATTGKLKLPLGQSASLVFTLRGTTALISARAASQQGPTTESLQEDARDTLRISLCVASLGVVVDMPLTFFLRTFLVHVDAPSVKALADSKTAEWKRIDDLAAWKAKIRDQFKN